MFLQPSTQAEWGSQTTATPGFALSRATQYQELDNEPFPKSLLILSVMKPQHSYNYFIIYFLEFKKVSYWHKYYTFLSISKVIK